MSIMSRAIPAVGASAVLCALLLRAQGEAQTSADREGGDCEAHGDGEDTVSYLQRFASEAKLDASSDEASTEPVGEGTALFYGKGDESNIPLPGEDYPEQFRGAFWLDQAGFYGFSDTGASAPDLIVSFADSLNKTSRKMTLFPGAPTWTWQNNEDAYSTFRELHLVDFEYDFEWNEDYTECRIYPAFHVFGYRLNVWSWLVDFRMVLQKPEEGACPPKAGASKEEVSKCAVFLRKSWVLIRPKWNVYPVFRVLDEEGAPIAPYYDEYVKYAVKTAEPDVKKAKFYLGDGVQGVKKGLWFAGPEARQDYGDVAYSDMARAMAALRRSMPRHGLI